MTEQEAQDLLKSELNRLGQFNNFHGITEESLEKFTLPPYKVLVDPDDLETEERYMWVVLKISEQTLIAIDPLEKGWSVLHPLHGDKFVQVIGEESLAEALDGM